MATTPARLAAVGSLAFLAALPVSGGELRDLYFGEALYYAYQDRYFDALERLDAELAQHYGIDEPHLDTLHYHINQAEFSVGDFELNYRMHHRAGRAIKAVLESNVDEAIRNEAAFRLARIHFQKDQPADALHAMDRISGRIPAAIRDDVEFLRANIYLSIGRPADAVEILQRLQSSESLTGYSAYNLGIALLQNGRRNEALKQLDTAGQLKVSEADTLAIRDKSNLVLGTLHFESSEFAPAQRSLERVRLEGPFSNQALLSAGWADVSAENYERALVPWSLLVEREVTDSAVQEALLALPYAYSKLNVHGRAAVLYGQAVEAFGQELGKLDASVKSIRDGKFLSALVREEIRQDKDWVIRLRSLPESPETYYLMALMASHDFQTGLQNYLDLEDLRKKLASWERSFDSFEDIISLRRQYYAPLLPGIDRQFRELDSQIRLRLEQREHLSRRLQNMLVAPRPDYLATADERVLLAQLGQLDSQLQLANPADQATQQARIARLEGVVTWDLQMQYDERLTEAYTHLQELNTVVDEMTARYEGYVRTRQAAVHSYEGYDVPMNQLRRRVQEALGRLNLLMARQGRMLETVAINELKARRQRLEIFQHQARYAFADSYDRAAKAQHGNEDQG